MKKQTIFSNPTFATDNLHFMVNCISCGGFLKDTKGANCTNHCHQNNTKVNYFVMHYRIHEDDYKLSSPNSFCYKQEYENLKKYTM